MLPCGHSLCSSCIGALARSRRNFDCPSCRNTTVVTDNTAGVPNFALLQALASYPARAAAPSQSPAATVPRAAAPQLSPSRIAAISPARSSVPPAKSGSQSFALPSPSPPHRPPPRGSTFLIGNEASILASAPPGFNYDPTQKAYYVPPGIDTAPYEEWLPRVQGSDVGVVLLEVNFRDKDEAKAVVRCWSLGALRASR